MKTYVSLSLSIYIYIFIHTYIHMFPYRKCPLQADRSRPRGELRPARTRQLLDSRLQATNNLPPIATLQFAVSPPLRLLTITETHIAVFVSPLHLAHLSYALVEVCPLYINIYVYVYICISLSLSLYIYIYIYIYTYIYI